MVVPRFQVGLRTVLLVAIAASVIVCGVLVHLAWWRTTSLVSRNLLDALERQIGDSARHAWWSRIIEVGGQMRTLSAAVEGARLASAREQILVSSALATQSLSWLVFVPDTGTGLAVQDLAAKSGPTDVAADVFQFDREGRVVARSRHARDGAAPPSPGDPGDTALTVFGTEWLTRPVTSDQPTWVAVAREPSGQRRAVALVARTSAGVLAAMIEYDRLAQILGEIPVGKTGRSYVIAPAGDVVIASTGGDASSAPRLGRAAEAAGRIVAARDAGAIDTTETRRIVVDGAAYQVELSPLSFQGWQLAIILPESDFLGEIDQVIAQVAMGLALFVVVAGTAGAFAARGWVAGPIQAVVDDLALVERFDLENIPRRRSHIIEIDQLSEAIVRMGSGLADFAKFIPTALVRSLLKDGMRAEPGGARREITVLFVDLAGFTALSEKLGDRVVPIVSQFLDLASTAIVANGGTVDKYIGDAVMAFWGAPGDDADQAAHACQAALAMQAAFDDLRRLEPQFQGLSVRIGVQSGAAIVGNIGSSRRLNYTALGDVVNLASRLEGVNKIYGTTILLGPETAVQVTDRFQLREIDRVMVYGRAEGVAVFELLAQDSAAEPARWIARYGEALAHYRSRNFADALGLLEELGASRPADGPALRLAGVCRRLIDAPPPPNWRPVTALDMK